MPDPVTFTTSQGFAAFGVTGATKVSVKASRKSDVKPWLENSTLALAHGATRTFEEGMFDYGQAGNGGIIFTVSMDGLGATAPTKGSTITVDGVTCKCMDVTTDNAVGELKKWSASYTSDYAA